MVRFPGASALAGGQDTTTWALFGQSSIEVRQDLTLTLGARYTWEEKDIDSLDGFHVDGEFVPNVANSKEMLRRIIPQLNGDSNCSCPTALKDTIITHPQGIAKELKTKLAPLVGRYLS